MSPGEKTELEKLKVEAQQTEKKLDRVLSYLENDDSTGKKGLVAEVAQMKTDHARVELKLDMFIADFKKKEAVTVAIKNTKATIFGAVGAGLIWLLKLIFERLFTHL